MMELDKLKEAREGIAPPAAAGENFDAKAVEDLKFLCTKAGFGLLNNTNYLALHDQGKKVCDFIVRAYVGDGKEVKFQSQLADFSDPKMHLAVVRYEDGAARDVYLFNIKNFEKPGFMSMFSHDKKAGTCGVKMGNKTKLEQYSFGNVVKNI